MTEEDILDTYLATAQRKEPAHLASTGGETGHRLLCPTCRAFQRTQVTYAMDTQTLQVKCKVCDTVEDFALYGNQGFVPRTFLTKMRSFARKRFAEVFVGGGDADR